MIFTKVASKPQYIHVYPVSTKEIWELLKTIPIIFLPQQERFFDGKNPDKLIGVIAKTKDGYYFIPKDYFLDKYYGEHLFEEKVNERLKTCDK